MLHWIGVTDRRYRPAGADFPQLVGRVRIDTVMRRYAA